MTKNVMLAINGLHIDEAQESGAVETLVPAEYYERNGSRYLFFTEENDSGEQTKTRIKFCENRLELERRGSLCTRMIFEEAKKHMTDYQTPYGSFLLGIETEKVLLEESEGSITVTVGYRLEMEEQHVSNSSIVLRVFAEASL